MTANTNPDAAQDAAPLRVRMCGFIFIYVAFSRSPAYSHRYAEIVRSDNHRRLRNVRRRTATADRETTR
ncbi:hypothetical protein ADILRU_2410 [Leifsonia rubra CMS 76R]|nr:hypothetical protein ADILRU_2410 [Leifsonia rubra CMS 76R]